MLNGINEYFSQTQSHPVREQVLRLSLARKPCLQVVLLFFRHRDVLQSSIITFRVSVHMSSSSVHLLLCRRPTGIRSWPPFQHCVHERSAIIPSDDAMCGYSSMSLRYACVMLRYLVKLWVLRKSCFLLLLWAPFSLAPGNVAAGAVVSH